MDDIIQKVEEKIIELLDKIDEGNKEALEELKKLKKAVHNLDEFMSFVQDGDTIESIENKMNVIEKKFDEFLMELNKVVG